MKTFFTWIIGVSLCGWLAYQIGLFLYEKQSYKVFTEESDYLVNVYFPDESRDPQHKVCDHVVPFERYITTSKVGVPLRTIQLLLEGPTGLEKQAGAYTAIPQTAKLLHFEITDEDTNIVLDYDFKHAPECPKQLIETQIQNTLFQFEEIPPVKINPTKLITPV